MAVFSLGVSMGDVLIDTKGLLHFVVLVGVVGLAGPRVGGGDDCS